MFPLKLQIGITFNKHILIFINVIEQVLNYMHNLVL